MITASTVLITMFLNFNLFNTWSSYGMQLTRERDEQTSWDWDSDRAGFQSQPQNPKL